MAILKSRVRAYLRKYLAKNNYEKIARVYNKFVAQVWNLRYAIPIEDLITCDQPLIFISQIPRSGGTLLRSLFDGHLECHVFPHELRFPKIRGRWTQLPHNVFSEPNDLYQYIYDRWIDHAIVNGYKKKYPFAFNRRQQRKTFIKLIRSALRAERQLSQREIFDCYFTSFFNSWIDYQNLYWPKKRYIVVFCPNLINIRGTKNFYQDYPDGYRIQILRDPFSWWASEKCYGKEDSSSNKEVESYLQNWISQSKKAIHLSKKYSDKYFLIDFTNLLVKPKETMSRLCNVLDLTYQDILLVPTFNYIPTTPNSSFDDIDDEGINVKPLFRWKDVLVKSEINYIKTQTKLLWNRARKLCINHELSEIQGRD